MVEVESPIRFLKISSSLLAVNVVDGRKIKRSAPVF